MVLTDTVHPPAGATAVLAATDGQVRQLGWLLLPMMMLSVVLMTGTGCLVGNVLRQWPLYWWREEGTGFLGKKHRKDVEVKTGASDAKGMREDRESDQGNEIAHGEGDRERDLELGGLQDGDEGVSGGASEMSGTTRATTQASSCPGVETGELGSSFGGGHVVVVPGRVILSEGLEIEEREREVLESLSQRLAL